MRFTMLFVIAALLAGCSKSPEQPVQMVQPGVPFGSPTAVQPEIQQQLPQQPQVIAVPQQPPQVVIQQQPQHDSTGALVTGMALGALLNSGGSNTTVYRDRYVEQPPVYRQAAPTYAPTYSTQRAPVQAVAPPAPQSIKPNFTPPPPPPARTVAAPTPAPARTAAPTVAPAVRAPAPPPPRAVASPAPRPAPAVSRASPPPPPPKR